MVKTQGNLGQSIECMQRKAEQCALTFLVTGVAAALLMAPGPVAAVGHVGHVDLVSRADGQVLPVYPQDGRHWVIGTPGQEYSVRVCNTTAGRMLAVMSVDGVNVITGDTASAAQSGYVLSGYECADISGWRKSMSHTAAFYFTELPDAYAARTGRPENVGVVGVALFPEKPQPVAISELPGKATAGRRHDESASRQEAAPAAEGRASAAGAMARDQSAPAPAAPLAKLGTGHGRRENSPTQKVPFERASSTPVETIAIHYDRRDNLVAMGILPPPTIARLPNPFPAWAPRFVPDPPPR